MAENEVDVILSIEYFVLQFFSDFEIRISDLP